MKVLVTGGAGFIGSHVVDRLLAAGCVVTVVDDLSTGDEANLAAASGRVDLRVGSVTDRALLDEALSGATTVVHLAARASVPRSIEDPVATNTANVDGTLAVLEAARASRERPHVIVASSSSVYGANPTLPKQEDQVAQPRSPYAVSKLAAEAYALAYAHSYGLAVLALRFFNVFGPRQAVGHAYAAVIPAFVDAALAGRPAIVHGDGTQTRDFTYVETVTAVVADAIQRRVTAEGPVNLAFGSRTDLLTVLDRLGALLGAPVDREHVAVRTGDVAHSMADSTRLRQLFPTVEAVGFDEGLAATVAWYRDRPGP